MKSGLMRGALDLCRAAGLAGATLSALLLPQLALAQNTWTGSDDTVWSNKFNWSAGNPPSPLDPPTLTGSNDFGNQPKLTADSLINGAVLTMNGTANPIGNTLNLGGFTLDVSQANLSAGTITGGTLRLSGDGTTPSTFSSGITIDSSVTVLTPGGFSGTTINLTGGTFANKFATVDTTQNTNFIGIAGNVTLSGDNSGFNGGILVNTGNVLTLANSAAGGTRISLAGGATLTQTADLNLNGGLFFGLGPGTVDTAGFNTTIAGQVSGIGRLVKTGAGTLTLQAQNNNFQGATVSSGTLQITGKLLENQTRGSIIVDNTGTFQVGPGALIQVTDLTTSGNGKVINNGTITGSGFSMNFGTTGNVSTTELNDANDINVLAGGALDASGVVSAPLVTNAGTFNVAGNLSGQGSAGLDHTGTIGEFRNQGTGVLNINSGTFSGIDVFTNSSTAATGVNVKTGTSLVVNTGAGTISNANNSNFLINGTVTSTGGFTNNGTVTLAGNGVLNGGLTNSAGNVFASGTAAINGAIANNAGFTVTGGTVTSDSTFDNQGGGTLSVTGGTYTVSGAITNAGGIAISPGGTLAAASLTQSGAGAVIGIQSTGALNVGLLQIDAGQVNNDGTITAASIANVGTFNLTANGRVAATGGTANYGNIVASGGAFASLVVNNPGGLFRVTGGGTVTAESHAFNNNGGTLQIEAGSTYSGLSTLDNSGTVTIATSAQLANIAGYTQTAGSTDNAGTIGLTGGLAVNGGTFTNSGAISANTNVSNAGTNFTNTGTITIGLAGGQLVNNAGGTFNMNGGTITTISGGSNSGTFNMNSGNFNMTGVLDGQFQNTGTFAMSGGTVSTAVSFINDGIYSQTGGNQSGLFINRATRTADLSGTASLTGGINNSGLVRVTGGTVSSGAFANVGPGSALQVNAGTLTLSGALSNGGGSVSTALGATLSGTSFIQSGSASTTNNGTLSLSSTLSVGTGTGFSTSGTLSAASGSSGASSFSVTGGTVTMTAGGFDNTGTYSQTAGTMSTTAGFTNSGAVTASGTAAINGGITNNAGTFTVTGGTVTSNAAFTNNATLSVTGGSYTIGGLLTNSGTVSVQGAGSTLTANSPGILNTGGGIINNGTLVGGSTINDDLDNNASTVNNAAAFNGIVNTNAGGGIINNLAGGVWTGNVTSNGAASAGTINNAGAWIGNISNSAFGTVNQTAGSITGAVTNLGTFNASGGAINGSVVNGSVGGANGTFNLTGTISGITVFTNNATPGGATPTGFLNYTGTTAMPGALVGNIGVIAATTPTSTLTVGQLNNTVAANIGNLNMLANSTSTNLITVTGTSAGRQNINFALVPGSSVPVFTTPRTVLDLNGGSLVVANRGIVPSLSNGLVNNFLVQGSAGADAFLQSVFNDGPVSGVSSGVSSIVAALNAGFFQPLSAIVSRPDNPHANQIGGGPFVRALAGDSNTTLNSNTTSFGSVSTSRSQGSTSFGGIQAGFDLGVYNIDSTDWNVNLGIFGGYVNARNYTTSSTPTMVGGTSQSSTNVTMDVPYVALYTFLSKRSFTAEINLRQDFYKGTVNSYNADITAGGGFLVAPNTQITGRGTSVNAIVANRFEISDSLYVEPLAGMTWGRFSFDDVYFNPALGSTGTTGRVALAPIETWLGRIGTNVGGTFLLSDKFALAPFVHGSIWHEFASATASTAYVGVGGQNLAFPLATDRVNTFGQVGIGTQFKFLDSNLLGFVRGDLRFGDSLNGKAINVGVRKQF